MLKNFFFIATRIFFRDLTYSTINILGLVVGLTCSIFIFLWVMDEVQYDRFHQDHDRIFQVMENNAYPNGDIFTYESTPAPLAEQLQNDFPEVEQTCRLSWEQRVLFSTEQSSIYHYGYYADTSFFHLFTFPLVEGDLNHLLPDLNSVVISKTMAAKYFQGSALGKVLRIDKETEVKVTGVFENVPDQSSLWFDFILPFQLYTRVASQPLNWDYHAIMTYVKLKADASQAELQPKIKDVLLATNPEGEISYLLLHPLKDWRLRSHFEQGLQSGGRIFYVVCFILIALFILIVACINFMNLATARAARRAREVGIRKVAGASRGVLIKQFMIESLLLSFLSLFIALLFVHLLTPLFNYLSNKSLSLDYTDPYLVLGLLGITLFTGILAGSYPAFFLSSFRPSSVLKGNTISAWRGVGLRKTLVLVQFGLSVVLIISAVVINDQVQYMLHKNLGYDKENVMHFEPQVGSLTNVENFRSELLKNPVIESVGQSFDHPMNIFNNDYVRWGSMPISEKVTVQTTECDYNYLQTLGFKLLQGRFFSPELASDTTSFIINEACAQTMGFADPIGQHITVYNMEGQIIGVVNDFHNQDLYSKMDPVIFLHKKAPEKPMTIYVRYGKGQLTSAMDHLQKTYKKFEPVFPLEVSFLDKDLERMYRTEILTGRLSVCFTVIAVFISCLGLFGLTLFTTERRKKEIGVRKVLGASVNSLVVLLCRDFMKPILFSLAVGLPIGYYLMTNFLNQFQFHVELRIWAFLLTGISLIMMTIITVSYQSTKAALTNPGETLRTE